MFEITWRRSARDSFLNAVSRLRSLATRASSSSLFSGSASGRFDGDGGAVSRRCGDEWRACKMAPTRVILMSCGSYNPPTNMHLRMFGMYIIDLSSSPPEQCRSCGAANIVVSRSVITHDVTSLPCVQLVYHVCMIGDPFLLNCSLYIFSQFFVPPYLMLHHISFNRKIYDIKIQ